MGHIAYLRKQFNSINTYDYHNVNWEKKTPIIYFMWIEWFFSWTILLKDAFAPNLVEIGPVVREKKIFNFIYVFLQFGNYLPLEKGGALHLNKFESPVPKDALCQVWLKLAQWFWKSSKIFFNFVNYLICIFAIL